MKKRIIIGGIIAILLFFVVPNMSNITEYFKIKFQKTPVKYEIYQNLRDLALDKKFDIKIIETSSVDYGQIYGDSNVWLVKRKSNKEGSEPDTEVYYKINREGIIIDSLGFTGEYIMHVDNYLINTEKSYYCTWLKDGDIAKKPFVSINNGSPLSTNELTPYLNDAEYIDEGHTTDLNSNKRLKKIIFYKENTWSEIITESKSYHSKTYKGNKTLPFLGINEVVDASYYKKETWKGHQFPDFGLHLNGKQPEHWRGTSYYDFITQNKSLTFKEQYVQLNKGSDTPNSKLSVYKNPNAKYIIINNGGYGNTDFTLYLIRF